MTTRRGAFIVLVKPLDTPSSAPTMLATRATMDESLMLGRMYCDRFRVSITEVDAAAFPMRVERTYVLDNNGDPCEVNT